jgi:hypothetical protein
MNNLHSVKLVMSNGVIFIGTFVSSILFMLTFFLFLFDAVNYFDEPTLILIRWSNLLYLTFSLIVFLNCIKKKHSISILFELMLVLYMGIYFNLANSMSSISLFNVDSGEQYYIWLSGILENGNKISTFVWLQQVKVFLQSALTILPTVSLVISFYIVRFIIIKAKVTQK